MKKRVMLCCFALLLPLSLAAAIGDVNNDGGITIVDALMTAQYYVGLNPSGFDSAQADINSDGSINIVDALMMAQIYVGLIDPPQTATNPPTSPPAVITLQAEEAAYDDAAVETEHAGYTGSGYLNTANATGSYLEWTLNTSASGNAQCAFTYANGGSASRPMDVRVNGSVVVSSLAFPVTGEWTSWATATATVYLNQGSNTLRLTSLTDEGGPNLDRVEIAFGGTITTPQPTTPPTSSPGDPFTDTPIGFASLNALGQNGTTGGAGGQTVTVSNQSDLENYAGASQPYIIKVQGRITISPFGREVPVASNKTIVGIGSDATIYQGGFILDPANNVIIRNLTIGYSYVEDDPDGKDQDYDAIQVDNSHHIWFDHCHFTHSGDGLMDLREATTYVTVSWCIFSNHNKCFGLGWTEDTEYKVTIHHTWIHDTNQRNPSFDNGIGHLYNNWLQNVESYGNYSRGAARLVIENSYFENVNDPYYPDDTAQLVARGNIVVNCTGRQETLGSAFNPSSYYSYTLDEAADVPNLLRTYAGPSSSIVY